jgi:hypothetical protein
MRRSGRKATLWEKQLISVNGYDCKNHLVIKNADVLIIKNIQTGEINIIRKG